METRKRGSIHTGRRLRTTTEVSFPTVDVIAPKTETRTTGLTRQEAKERRERLRNKVKQ
jgi:hypothetical protein